MKLLSFRSFSASLREMLLLAAAAAAANGVAGFKLLTPAHSVCQSPSHQLLLASLIDGVSKHCHIPSTGGYLHTTDLLLVSDWSH